MKNFTLAILLLTSISASFAAQCSLDQNNACVLFVAPGGNLCSNTICQEENNTGTCSVEAQATCDKFLLAGGITCTYIPDDPYFTCQA
ncbi:hypothetical protein BD408DRAFT_425305 [Parasitella parasitica]|nr:hypothetical protein BD408DRAFT_425305 [Parasitella parasitica]